MRVLLDENLPRDLVGELTGHQVTTVQAVGWAGTTNGELLRLAAGHFDALVTMDRSIQHQQNLRGLALCVLVIRSPSNRMTDLASLVESVLAVLSKPLPAGQILEIGA